MKKLNAILIDLMVYAQISSRIGGAIVLLIASVMFAFL